MRLYLELMRVSFRRHRAYGAANIAGLLTNGFFGLLRSYVFIALFQARPIAEGYDLRDALTYTWITQALIMPVMLWGWTEIAATIESGDVVSDFSKPFSYFGYWLSRDYGRAAYYTLFRALPTALMGFVLFHILLPRDPRTWVLFAASVLIAIAISFCIRFLINLSAFWTTDVRGFVGMALLFTNFMSGFVVPVEFFPPWLRSVAEALPFAGMVSVPMNVWLERADAPDLFWLVLRQALWVGVLVLASQAMLRAATRKLVVQGG